MSQNDTIALFASCSFVGTSLVLTTVWALWGLQRGSRDGRPITAGHDRCQRKHVGHPALAEANDLHVDLGLSVEQ